MACFFSTVDVRFYTREAATVAWDNSTSSYTSDDLDDGYGETCAYLPGCALLTGTSCGGNDRFENRTRNKNKNKKGKENKKRKLENKK